MRVSVGPKNSVLGKSVRHVAIDGDARAVDVAILPDDVHAVHWDSTSGRGWVEYVQDPFDDKPPRPNQPITSFDGFRHITEVHAETKKLEPPPEPDFEKMKEEADREIRETGKYTGKYHQRQVR